jgi:uncharacterized protein (TIGR02118 family)
MHRVTILYPTTEGASFDLDYYCKSHMPMLVAALGENCKGWGVDNVVNGPYEAIGWALVDHVDGFNEAMKTHGAAILGDVANYTTIQPTLVIGEVAV